MARAGLEERTDITSAQLQRLKHPGLARPTAQHPANSFIPFTMAKGHTPPNLNALAPAEREALWENLQLLSTASGRGGLSVGSGTDHLCRAWQLLELGDHGQLPRLIAQLRGETIDSGTLGDLGRIEACPDCLDRLTETLSASLPLHAQALRYPHVLERCSRAALIAVCTDENWTTREEDLAITEAAAVDGFSPQRTIDSLTTLRDAADAALTALSSEHHRYSAPPLAFPPEWRPVMNGAEAKAFWSEDSRIDCLKLLFAYSNAGLRSGTEVLGWDAFGRRFSFSLHG